MAEVGIGLRQLRGLALAGCVLVLAACASPESPLLKDIQSLESQAFEGDSLRPDVRCALMVKYADFARLEGDHPFVPEALFRRADLLVSAGKFDHAILQLQDVHDGYPAFDNRPLCAFLVAFIYDEHLKDKELARRSYERVMALHPDTPEAMLAQQSLALVP